MLLEWHTLDTVFNMRLFTTLSSGNSCIYMYMYMHTKFRKWKSLIFTIFRCSVNFLTLKMITRFIIAFHYTLVLYTISPVFMRKNRIENRLNESANFVFYHLSSKKSNVLILSTWHGKYCSRLLDHIGRITLICFTLMLLCYCSTQFWWAVF